MASDSGTSARYEPVPIDAGLLGLVLLGRDVRPPLRSDSAGIASHEVLPENGSEPSLLGSRGALLQRPIGVSSSLQRHTPTESALYSEAATGNNTARTASGRSAPARYSLCVAPPRSRSKSSTAKNAQPPGGKRGWALRFRAWCRVGGRHPGDVLVETGGSTG